MSAEREFFNYIGFDIDVTEAIEITKGHERRSANVEAYRNTLSFGGQVVFGGVSVDPVKAADADTTNPIIVATIAYSEYETTQLVVDGHHRIFKRLYIENESSIPAVFMTAEETLKCMQGPLAEHLRKYIKKQKIASHQNKGSFMKTPATIDFLYHARVITDIQQKVTENGHAVVFPGTKESQALFEGNDVLNSIELQTLLVKMVDTGEAVFTKETYHLLFAAKTALAKAGGQPLSTVAV